MSLVQCHLYGCSDAVAWGALIISGILALFAITGLVLLHKDGKAMKNSEAFRKAEAVKRLDALRGTNDIS